MLISSRLEKVDFWVCVYGEGRKGGWYVCVNTEVCVTACTLVYRSVCTRTHFIASRGGEFLCVCVARGEGGSGVCVCMCVYVHMYTDTCVHTLPWSRSAKAGSLWQFPLKMQRPRNPPYRETQIPQYTFKLNQNIILNCTARYREFWVSQLCGFWERGVFSGNCHIWISRHLCRWMYLPYTCQIDIFTIYISRCIPQKHLSGYLHR